MPDGSPNKYTKAIFDQAALWFDKPSNFNDPFDCNLKLWTSKTPEHIVNQARAEALKNWSGFPHEIVNSVVDTVVANPAIANRTFEQHREYIYEKSSVFCWATRGDNIAMFAYYAADHTGICLEFDLEHRHEAARVMSVEYENKLPELDYSKITETDQLVKSLLLTKARCWDHEEERRVVRQGIGPGLVHFPKEALIRVIFGCRATDDDITLVKSWMANWSTPVILAKAKPDEADFRLMIEDFETVQCAKTASPKGT